MANDLTKEQVLAKVRKLMALSEGTDFEGETAAALNMIRTLLAKYNLAMSDVGEDKELEPIIRVMDDVAKGYWQPMLASVIAEYTNCETFNRMVGRKHRKVAFIGMELELEVCIYTYHNVERQIDKLTRKLRKKLRDERSSNGEERKNSRASSEMTRGYVLGIMETLGKRLDERKQAELAGDELVLVKHPKVQEWFDNNVVRGRKVSHSITPSGIGFEQGLADGHQISLSQGIKGGKRKGEIE